MRLARPGVPRRAAPDDRGPERHPPRTCGIRVRRVPARRPRTCPGLAGPRSNIAGPGHLVIGKEQSCISEAGEATRAMARSTLGRRAMEALRRPLAAAQAARGAVAGVAVPGRWLLRAPAVAAVAGGVAAGLPGRAGGTGAVTGSLGVQELPGHRRVAVVLPGGPG